jgi:hypothetical protein
MIVVCKLFGCDTRFLMIGSSLEPMSWFGLSMFAFVKCIDGLSVGLCLVVCLLVAPLFVILPFFGLIALSDVEGITSGGLLYCYKNLIKRVKSNQVIADTFDNLLMKQIL